MQRRVPVHEPQRCLCFFSSQEHCAHSLYRFFCLVKWSFKNFFGLESSLELMCAVPNFFVFETQAHCVLHFFSWFFGSARIHAGKSEKMVDSVAHPLENFALRLPLLYADGVQDACLHNILMRLYGNMTMLESFARFFLWKLFPFQSGGARFNLSHSLSPGS